MFYLMSHIDLFVSCIYFTKQSSYISFIDHWFNNSSIFHSINGILSNFNLQLLLDYRYHRLLHYHLWELHNHPVKMAQLPLLMLKVKEPPNNNGYQDQSWQHIKQIEKEQGVIDNVVEALIHSSLSCLVQAKHIKQRIVNILKDLLLEVLSFINVLVMPSLQLI